MGSEENLHPLLFFPKMKPSSLPLAEVRELLAVLNASAEERTDTDRGRLAALQPCSRRVMTFMPDLSIRELPRRPVTPTPSLVMPTRNPVMRQLLYDQIVALQSAWHSEDEHAGKIKVVYSGTPADSAPGFRPHALRLAERRHQIPAEGSRGRS